MPFKVRTQTSFQSAFVMCTAGSHSAMQSASDGPPPAVVTTPLEPPLCSRMGPVSVVGSVIAGVARVGGIVVATGGVKIGFGSPPLTVARDSAVASQLPGTPCSQAAMMFAVVAVVSTPLNELPVVPPGLPAPWFVDVRGFAAALGSTDDMLLVAEDIGDEMREAGALSAAPACATPPMLPPVLPDP